MTDTGLAARPLTSLDVAGTATSLRRFVVFDPCGHCPNVERAEEWNALVVDFLSR
jgi:pimeloyl-ACP methyl ester carboxylesterase